MSVFEDAMDEQLDLAFETFGTPGKWQYKDALIRRFHNDRELTFGQASMVTEANILKVRVSEITMPCEGDLVQVYGSEYSIVGEPERRDRRGRVWTCQAVLL